MVNQNMLHDHHDLDALIRAALLHPTEQIKEKLIEAGIDNHGDFVGYAVSQWVWDKLIPSL